MVPAVFAAGYYLAALILVAGLGYRLSVYARTPQPLRIPLTPAPTTSTGVVLRLAREALLFSSLFKASKWTWLFGWSFHLALYVLLVKHLFYVTGPVWSVTHWAQQVSLPVTLVALFGLSGLLARRLLVDRIRYVSAASDYLLLLLFIAIVSSGLGLRFAAPVNVIAVKEFVRGLAAWDWGPLPGEPLLLAHLFLVWVLLMVFPFSKLLHAPGVFFSPSLNQRDSARGAGR